MNPFNKLNERLMKEKSINTRIKSENTKLKTKNARLDEVVIDIKKENQKLIADNLIYHDDIEKENQKLIADNLIYHNSVSYFCDSCPIKGNVECEGCSLNKLAIMFDLWEEYIIEKKSKKK